MDAVKFVMEYLRMCTKVDDCEGCPVHKTDFCMVPAKERSQDSAEEVVRLVEEWSAAHPRKTRQSVFLEQWPNCMIDNDGVVGICPRNVDNKCICNLERFYDFRGCSVCRRKFWMQEVE